MSVSDLVGLLSGISGSAGTVSSGTQTLVVPSSLYVFHQYYWEHYYYTYDEEYSFDDKILIFDNKQKIDKDKVNEILFQRLKYSGNRTFRGNKYRNGHHAIDGFVDWSKNHKGFDSLKNILRFNIDKPQSLFTHVDNDIRLEYNFSRNRIIPWYAFYFNGYTDANHFQKINFGKLKNNHLNLKTFKSSVPHVNNCYSGWITPYVSGADVDSEGYDGHCDSIGMTDVSPFKHTSTVMWNTPYVAYKHTKKGGWDNQYYHYVLGNYSSNEKKSENLLKEGTHGGSWFVNYDDVFSVEPEGDHLRISLNKNSKVVEELDINDATESNKKLMDFLKVSSMLDFDISFRQLGDIKRHYFTLKDVLEDRAKVPVQSEYQMFSDFTFSVKVKRGLENVVLANSNQNYSRYYYRLNMDAMKAAGKLFESLTFDKTGIEDMFPTELMDPKKLASRFVFSSEGGTQKTSSDVDLLKHLKITGEMDDDTGTAHITYHFNDQTHRVDIYNMQTLPDLSGEKFVAEDIPDAMNKLKDKRKDITSQYFWDNLFAQEKISTGEWNTTSQIYLSSRNPIKSNGIRSRKRWNFYGYDIRIKKTQENHLIPKLIPPAKYKNISDLFDLSEYAKSFNLTKSDYQYHVLEENQNQMQVLVRLDSNQKIPRTNMSLSQGEHSPTTKKWPPFQKIYTLDVTGAHRDNSPSDSKGSSTDNTAMVGSAVVFTTTALFMIMKKLGILKRFRPKARVVPESD